MTHRPISQPARSVRANAVVLAGASLLSGCEGGETRGQVRTPVDVAQADAPTRADEAAERPPGVDKSPWGEWEPPYFVYTTVFSPQSYLMEPDFVAPNPVELDLDCEDTDAVVARCEEVGVAYGWPKVACRLRRNQEVRWHAQPPGDDLYAERGGARERFHCENSPWCSYGRPEADLTNEQRRYSACGSLWLLGPCGGLWQVQFHELRRQWLFVAWDNLQGTTVREFQPPRFGMRAGVVQPSESDAFQAYREVFLGEGAYPWIYDYYCEPTHDEMACVCSPRPEGRLN